MTNDKFEKICTDLETISRAHNLVALGSIQNAFKRGAMVARGIAQLREILDAETMKDIMALMNSPLGFFTDKDPAKPVWDADARKYVVKNDIYSEKVVKECYIEATLRGLEAVGSQWGIISGRFYCGKNGFSHLFKNMPGFVMFPPVFDKPKPAPMDQYLEINATAKWVLHGEEGKLEKTLYVKQNKGLGLEAVLGKAERKLMAAVYFKVTGVDTKDGDADDAMDHGSIETTAKKATDDLNAKLKEALTPLQQKVKDIDPKTLAQIRGELQLPLTHELTDDQCSLALRAAEALK